MKDVFYSIHPYTRICFLALGITGTIFANRITILSLYWLFTLIPFFVINRKLVSHIKVLLFVFLPIYLSYILIYVWASKFGFDYVSFRVAKLMVFATVIQIFFSFKSNEQIDTFLKWKFKGNLLLVILGTFSVIDDIVKQSDKIVTARYARGFIKDRNIYNTIKQIPQTLVPLFAIAIRTSIERSDSWERKDMLSLLSNWEQKRYRTHYLSDIWILITTTLYLVISL
ncbi:MAG: energy-coupling factor transporter transmembrane component T [Bacteroidales bacterium]|nr:energy-coupling factor transporter transmembrane component T [Bacteroidales bacterium]